MDNYPSSIPAVPSQPSVLQPLKQHKRSSRSREKPQLSCNLCRRRKLKCDRAQPCETCVRRGVSLSCSYPPRSSDRKQLPPATSVNMRDRIGQLEKLVTSLMDNLKSTQPLSQVAELASVPESQPSPTGSDPPASIMLENRSQLSDNFGRINLGNSETNYVEGAHWTAILDEIADLKDCFEDDKSSEEQWEPSAREPDDAGPEIIFGHSNCADRQQILAGVPPRPVCDRLIRTYFASMDLAPVFIHRPTFLEEYERFWVCPADLSTMWLGMLFSMICTATLFENSLYTPPSTPPDLLSISESRLLIHAYREKVIQCLCLGGYMKCVPYTIETLTLYLLIEFSRSEDTRLQTWILLGLIVRLALRMGYHRDGSHSSRISPFQTEMRRRIWAMIFQLDVVTAIQFGLPRMIREAQSDTAEPLNLLDEDLYEDLVALPQPRPDTEITPILFLITKNRLVSVLAMIADMATFSTPFSADEILSLDEKLQDTYKAFPVQFQMRPIAESTMDESRLIFGRLILVLLFHKAECILHRKYLVLARTDGRYVYSRNKCIEAALNILHLQSMLSQETRLNGRLYEHRWKMSSITKQEFLLATMILCSEVAYEVGPASSAGPQHFSVENDTRERIDKALNDSYAIWLESSDSSREARKAAQALKFVLHKTGSTRATSTGSNRSVNNDSPQYTGATFPLDSPTMDLNLPDFMPMDTNFSAESFGMPVDSFAQREWISKYQMQSADEFLDMSDWVGLSGFPF